MQSLLVPLLLLGVAAPRGLSVQLTVDEGGRQARYRLRCAEGRLLVEPEDEKVSLLVDVEAKIVTLIFADERVYCRADAVALERLTRFGIVKRSWFPWFCEASADLLEDIEIRETPEGRTDHERSHVEVVSKRYGRPVAFYRLDRRWPGDWYFQFRRVYFDFWDPEQGAAQKARLDLYGRLKGLPLQAEERFLLLSRPRIMRFERWKPIGEDRFWDPPQDYKEKSVAQLVWSELVRRFKRWLRPRRRPFVWRTPLLRRARPAGRRGRGGGTEVYFCCASRSGSCTPSLDDRAGRPSE